MIIDTLTLKAGRSPGVKGEPIKSTPITIFVGPNNSGKSKVLDEILNHCRTGYSTQNYKVLETINFTKLSIEDAQKYIKKMAIPAPIGYSGNPAYIHIKTKDGAFQIHLQDLLEALTNPNSADNSKQLFTSKYSSDQSLLLDGKSRIKMCEPQTAGDLQDPPNYSLQILFRDDKKRKEVRRIVHEAFGSYFVIDPSNLGKLRIRLSATPPSSEAQERGLHEEAITFHSNAQPIEEASDGVKAFTGIITELVAGDPKILLVDEPEAFLHPALATKLGFEMSRISLKTKKNVFISTHSPAFLMGCIQSGAPINIIRLTYRRNTPTARILPSDEILKLMRHPLLRSTGVLSGLFYEHVVISESDADRAFYQEINERLLQKKPEWGIPNCLFLNAQNKQTIHTLMAPLRKLGIPTAGIVDIDILKEGGKNWSSLLDSASAPHISKDSLGQSRQAIKIALERTGKDMKTQGGISLLTGSELEAAEDLLQQLNNYGIFTVPNGELESWVKSLDVKGHGPSWLVNIFEKMGDDPESNDYINPTDEDVWAFMGLIKEWLTNPDRKGIPA